jgi:cyclopropane fatty-acyl-phospholipid synthase-like methyltransferase
MTVPRLRLLALSVSLAFLPFAGGRAATGGDKERKYNLVYVPTPEAVVQKMFDMAKVGKNDVVFDLGCGDGRIVAMAAKQFGARGVGIDLNPQRIKEAQETVKKYKVEKLVEIREGDALKVKDLDRATVVALYMLPEFLNWFEPIAKKTLKPGTRIVSHDYKWDSDWAPDRTVEFKGPERTHTLYVWTVPKSK